MAPIAFLRQFRVGGYAIFDTAVSFLGVYLLSPWLSKLFLQFKIVVPRKSWLFLTLPISILVHFLVGNITPMTKNFMDLNGHYILKAVIFVLLFFGLKDIKVRR